MFADLPRGTSEYPIQLLTSDEEFDALQPEWDELLAHAENASFFVRWGWCRHWWNTYAPARARLYLLACRNRDGQLQGIAPLYWRQHGFGGFKHIRELNFLGTGTTLKTSEHLDVPTRPGAERAFASAAVKFLESRKDWDRLHLWGVKESSVVLQQIRKAIGSDARTTPVARLPWIRTDTDWTIVREQMSPSLRKNVDNRTRSLARTHATNFRRVRTVEELAPAFEDFVRLHQMRWRTKGQPGSFSLPRFETFLFEAMREALEVRSLLFWTYHVDEVCAAVLVAFLHNGTAYFFQTGFDPTFSKYSIGSLIIARCIQDCLADPEINEFDFMGGDKAYKYLWSQQSRHAVELILERQGWRMLAYRGGKDARRRLGQLKRALILKSSLRQPNTPKVS